MASPNRQYESMLTVARERLSRHAPESIARRAGVTWDGGRLTLPSLGQTVTVTVPDFAVSPELDMWHALTLLHYLDLADGTPLLGKMMAFAQYPDGMVRVAIQNFLKNPVISMVFGHPNRKISCISPHIRAAVLKQPPFFYP